MVLISKRSNFNLLDFVFIRQWKKSKNSIILNKNHRQNPLASKKFRAKVLQNFAVTKMSEANLGHNLGIIKECIQISTAREIFEYE